MVKFRAEAAQSDPVMQFVMCLLHSVTNAHILHFQSLSYSQHMALGAYYDEVSDLVDGFVAKCHFILALALIFMTHKPMMN